MAMACCSTVYMTTNTFFVHLMHQPMLNVAAIGNTHVHLLHQDFPHTALLFASSQPLVDHSSQTPLLFVLFCRVIVQLCSDVQDAFVACSSGVLMHNCHCLLQAARDLHKSSRNLRQIQRFRLHCGALKL
ncbi:TPA: hypothetical protein ACH3X1_015896 [Trebouxia sp. C0004]